MLTDKLKSKEEVCWVNPAYLPFDKAAENCVLSIDDIYEASSRLDRFAPYIMTAFPETADNGGIIESELTEIDGMKKLLEEEYEFKLDGRLYLKKDSHLPVAGSVKARGGVYEILKLAEDIAISNGYVTAGEDYSVFAGEKFRSLFSQYYVAVGSTGNLGLSIGIISAKLGFNVSVHMSSDARQWKKDMLRANGVNVIEYASDYSEAVKQGRLEAEKDSRCYFVDDENSVALFLGYSVAALRLKKQLDCQGIKISRNEPLMVYLPCGVGGAPGGIAFGLKQVFGDSVHCFFCEPVNAPCMLLGLTTGLHNKISVQDIGLDGITAADGLAVGRASGFVGRIIEPFLAGCYTIKDSRLTDLLKGLSYSEGINLEPSALAGMFGPVLMNKNIAFSENFGYGNATHIVWATGGGMVPADEMSRYLSN